MTDARTASRTATRAGAALVALVVVVSGLALVVGTAAASTAAKSRPDTRPGTVRAISVNGYEVRVRHWINVRRSQNDLPALLPNNCARRTASRWSQHLADNDAFYHQDMGDVLDRCSARYAAETLGKGVISPKQLVALWMDSPGHRDILLSRTPRHIGVGSVLGSDGQWLTTANFVRT